jgi:hypothetical protein
MPGNAAIVARRKRDYQASLPVAPWGHDWTSPIHQAHHDVDSARASQVAR